MAAYFVAKNYVPAGQALCLNGQKLCPTPQLVADIKVVTPRTVATGLPSPRDTKLVRIETQTLARGSI
jgi:hypothetical protein